jgi:predicted RNA-binding Zn ribbon-like protein
VAVAESGTSSGGVQKSEVTVISERAGLLQKCDYIQISVCKDKLSTCITYEHIRKYLRKWCDNNELTTSEPIWING